MAQPQKFITEEGRERLMDELRELRAVRRPGVAGRIYAAATAGGAADGGTRRFTIVGGAEARPLEGRISNESPVGQALLGRAVGDVVEISTRAGNRKLTIVRAD